MKEERTIEEVILDNSPLEKSLRDMIENEILLEVLVEILSENLVTSKEE